MNNYDQMREIVRSRKIPVHFVERLSNFLVLGGVARVRLRARRAFYGAYHVLLARHAFLF